MKSVNIGLCGLGTVGSGTFNVLRRNIEAIQSRAGCTITIAQVGARRDNPLCDTSSLNVSRDIFDVAKNPDIDISGAYAIADAVGKMIAISEGSTDVEVTEEIVHIATQIIEEKNPGLVTEMISKIGRFKIYKDTLKQYRNIPAYQLEDGRPNIRKIKKEKIPI